MGARRVRRGEKLTPEVKDMELLSMHETSFLQTAQPSKENTAVEWRLHFICLP